LGAATHWKCQNRNEEPTARRFAGMIARCRVDFGILKTQNDFHSTTGAMVDWMVCSVMCKVGAASVADALV
jgi:hypothetical protein